MVVAIVFSFFFFPEYYNEEGGLVIRFEELGSVVMEAEPELTWKLGPWGGSLEVCVGKSLPCSEVVSLVPFPP